MSPGCTGWRTARALLDLLRPHVERVAAIYDTLGAARSGRLPDDPQALETALAAAGFADPALARAPDRGLARRARSARCAPPPAREAFEAMLPVLVEALRRGARSDRAR